jgi:hypothetical protein
MELVKCSDGTLRGYGTDNEDAWRRFNTFRTNLGAGECFMFSYRRQRNPLLHRKFMKMLRVAFDHWEPERGRKRLTYKGKPIAKDFDRFRHDILILAGFFTPQYDARGRVKLEPIDISFNKLDDDDWFAEIYEKVLLTLMEHVLTNYKGEDVNRVLAEIERFGS